MIVRSTHAHGIIRGIETQAAREMPGVLGIYTGKDLADYGPLKCIITFKNRDGSEMRKPPRPALASDKVRFVGDPVAFVAAETLLQAKDAAEAVALDIESLPAVTKMTEADRPGAPVIYDEARTIPRLSTRQREVARAFAARACRQLHLVNTRVVVSAMEPRAAIGVRAAKEHWTLHSRQGVFG